MNSNDGARNFQGDKVDPSALITMMICLVLGAAFWAVLFAVLANA